MDTQPLAQFDASQIDVTTFKDWGITFFNTGTEALEDKDIVLVNGKPTKTPQGFLTFGDLKSDFSFLQSLAAQNGHKIRVCLGADRMFILDDYKKALMPGENPVLSEFEKRKEKDVYTMPATTIDRIIVISSESGKSEVYDLDKAWAANPEGLNRKMESMFGVIQDSNSQVAMWEAINSQLESAVAYIDAGNALESQFANNQTVIDAVLVMTFLATHDHYNEVSRQPIAIMPVITIPIAFADDNDEAFSELPEAESPSVDEIEQSELPDFAHGFDDIISQNINK